MKYIKLFKQKHQFKQFRNGMVWKTVFSGLDTIVKWPVAFNQQPEIVLYQYRTPLLH